MTYRQSLIERAYAVADSGTCANPGQVKRALAQEGFTIIEIQTQLYGPTMTTALMKRCKASYVFQVD